MREKMYVSDIIGDQYKNWMPGKFYFLTAGTGTGKSTFIIKQLLDYAIQTNKKVLYLVNRSLLRDQLKQEINETRIFDHGNAFIDVRTYQECEKLIKDRCANDIKSGDPNLILTSMNKYINTDSFATSFSRECGILSWEGWLAQYGYIICDEAHYFSHDSIFNTNTSIIYKAILGRTFAIHLDGTQSHLPYDRAICVFMSATLGKLKDFVIRDIRRILADDRGNKVGLENGINSHLGEEFPMPTDYSYVSVHLINGVDAIPQTVADKKGKWFVFINDKEKGKKIVRDINKKFGDPDPELNEDEKTDCMAKKRKAVFIDADYYDEEEESQEKDRIRHEHYFDCDVLVSTSVLDNGISINDKKTRRIIILADMEDDFIQMLGRIRVNTDDKVDLYICPRGIGDFASRLNRVVRPHLDCYAKIIRFDQMVLTDKMLNPRWHQYLCHFVSSCAGLFFINEFSIDRFIYMKESYEGIAKELKDDPNAFLRRQFEWLGKSEEEMQKCLSEDEKETLPKLKEILKLKITKFVDKPIDVKDRQELREVLYGTREDFQELHTIRYKFGDKLDKKVWEQIGKPSAAMSKPAFNKLCDAYDLPFVMLPYKDDDKDDDKDKDKGEDKGAKKKEDKKYIIQKK